MFQRACWERLRACQIRMTDMFWRPLFAVHANAIITLNARDFPEECLQQYDVYRQSPDEFLVHQFHLSPELVLEKIDAQAIAIRQTRSKIIEGLDEKAPKFAALIRKRSS
jgi:hypothetical protein